MTTVGTSAAERDLEAIGDYVAEQDREAAAKLIVELRRKVASLSSRPERQRVRPEYGGQRRRVNCRGYAIIYACQPAHDLVRVSRILHGSRNIQRLLRP